MTNQSVGSFGRTSRWRSWMYLASQAAYSVVTSVELTVSAVLGARVAPTLALATAPNATAAVTAALVPPLMGTLAVRLGTKRVVVIGAVLGIVGMVMIALAAQFARFDLFLVGSAFSGAARSGSAYIRYAAADSVEASARKRIFGLVVGMGLAGAIIGPWLSELTQEMSAALSGPYWACAALYGFVAIMVGVGGRRTEQAGRTGENASAGGDQVSIATALRSDRFLVGVAGIWCSGAVMTVMMVAAPLAGRQMGHTAHTGSTMIQLHLLAMFLPALILSGLMTKLGSRASMVIGSLIFCVSGAVAISTTGASGMMTSLTLNGLGWSLVYASGGADLVESYNAGEGGRIQRVTETVSAILAVVANIAAAWLLSLGGWRLIGIVVLVLPLLLAIFVGVVSHRMKRFGIQQEKGAESV